MKALLLTVAVIILIPYIIYRLYLGYVILTQKRKYNKSKAFMEWQINNNPIERFFRYGTFKKIEIKDYDYKILKEDEDIEKDETKS